jgi:hypothetical protein
VVDRPVAAVFVCSSHCPFYFLLPDNWLSRIVIVSLFGVGMYALFLTENIYSVAAVRTIQLLRAAHAVGFLLSILTVTLLYNTVYSFQWSYWINGLLVAAVSYPVFFRVYGRLSLNPKLPRYIWSMSAGLSVFLGMVGLPCRFCRPVSGWRHYSWLLACM